MERTYQVVLKGDYPLIMHADSVDWADQMKAWREDAGNKKASVAGDDRSPAFRWIGAAYHDGTHLGIPAENVKRCLMDGGAQVPVPGGKRGKTFKAQTQSGVISSTPFWTLYVRGEPIKASSLQALMNEPDFSKHQAAVRELGFDLLVKRATIGKAKHVRVRPIFNEWELRGELVAIDEDVTIEALRSILLYAGRYKGLGDWRPGSPTPGPYGTFSATVA